MSVVNLDPSSYKLKPLDTIERLLKAPGFMTDPHSSFAQFVVDNLTRASATNSSITAEATVMMAQAHMGATLFRQQKDTSRLLAGFVYKMLVPDKVVPTGTRFCKRYRITDQREAQHGTYDTITNGVQSREYSQVFQHKSFVVTMQFGCLLSITVPTEAFDLIKRELDMASTSWELTRTTEVLRYCAAQPTLTDRIAHRTTTVSRAEKLDSVLIMAELMCGMVNIQPDSFVCALENARRILASDKPEVVIVGDTLFRVISQRSCNVWLQIVSEDTRITPEFSVYTMANENSRGGGGYDFTMQQVTQQALGDKDLPFTNESCFRDSPFDMKVHHIGLGGGPTDRIPIVTVDSVQMELGGQRNTSTEHKAFCNSEGFKWEYFTVGCTAPALHQINPSNVLSTTDSDGVNYKQLAQRSPCTSYLHQYDGAVASVSLRSLHPVGNPQELFTSERRARLQQQVNTLMRGDLNAIPVATLGCLARSRDWYSKINNPASVLEFDTRNMVVPMPDDNNPVQVGQWLVRPRVALFNSSAMNSIDNEMAQIGSELLTHFGDTQQAKLVQDNLTFLDRALHHEHGIGSMIELRRKILAGEVPQEFETEWTKGRSFWSWIADPICAVHIRHVLVAKEGASSGTITAEERTVLLQLEGLMNGLIGLFKAIVGSRLNSVIASMPACYNFDGHNVTDYGYPRAFSLDDVDYCNLMYWIILPALGARVYRIGACSGDESARVHIKYRRQDRNLTKELDLANSNLLTVMRLNGNCAFSKAALRTGVDVSDMFEPTALTHERSSDTGFSATSVVTYMWAIRLQKLTGISNDLAKVLLGMHYSTLLTHNVIREHYDTKYYSGMSYLLFRGVRFTGCGVSLIRQKSALYTLGTEILCKPTSHNTHQVHTVNQYCESTVIPETIESPGVHIPNLYMKDVRGGDVHIHTNGPFDMVVADAFNGFCPESECSSGYRRPYIFTTGRSERLNGSITKDPWMLVDAYTCMPSLLHPFSSVRRGVNKYTNRDRNEESNHKLFRETLHIAEFEKGVLDPIGDPFKDTVERVNGDKRTTDIMQPKLGVAYCGTYSIGLTSDKKLMCASDLTQETLLERLAPRINGTGIFACNPIQTTTRLINPIFNRIFANTRYSRYLNH